MNRCFFAANKQNEILFVLSQLGAHSLSLASNFYYRQFSILN